MDIDLERRVCGVVQFRRENTDKSGLEPVVLDREDSSDVQFLELAQGKDMICGGFEIGNVVRCINSILYSECWCPGFGGSLCWQMAFETPVSPIQGYKGGFEGCSERMGGGSCVGSKVTLLGAVNGGRKRKEPRAAKETPRR